jgi:hypothetical protein
VYDFLQTSGRFSFFHSSLFPCRLRNHAVQTCIPLKLCNKTQKYKPIMQRSNRRSHELQTSHSQATIVAKNNHLEALRKFQREMRKVCPPTSPEMIRAQQYVDKTGRNHLRQFLDGSVPTRFGAPERAAPEALKLVARMQAPRHHINHL